MKNPKVLIGCPTYFGKEYSLKQYKKAVDEIDYNNFEVVLIDNSDSKIDNGKYFEKIKNIGLSVIKSKTFRGKRDTIVFSRNLLRAKVLEENFDYFLSLEQDVIPPPDVIKKLLSSGKEIVGGVVFYYNWNEDFTKSVPSPLLWDFDPADRNSEYMYYVAPEELKKSQVKEIKACSLSCLLIHRSVLERVRFRIDQCVDGFDDVFFCIDARKAGFKIYVDTDVKCDHLKIKGKPNEFVNRK